MQKIICLLLLATTFCLYTKGQNKTVFNNNVTLIVPANWYIKDSTDKKIGLRKTGDDYSKIEIKIYEHKDKDLVKYMALDKKKFQVDPHTRTVLPDANLGGKVYKKIKYLTKAAGLKVDTDLEYVLLQKLKFPYSKIIMGRIEIVITYGQSQEAAMTKVADALVASLKY
jgi:hypothetical protein